MATATTDRFDALLVGPRPAAPGSGRHGARPGNAVEREAPRDDVAGIAPDGGERSTRSGTAELDRALVRRVQAGDKTAFDLLVTKYQHRVMGLLARYISDPSEREDVAQETFLRAYRGLERFRGESRFYTWLYRIAVNTATNHMVAAGRRPASRGADPEEAEQFDGGTWLQETDTPEGHAAMGEVQRAIGHGLDAMPESLRRAITLREVDGLAYEEIAEVMGCPIGTVRSRIARARMVLDEFLQPVVERPGPVAGR